jgi:hypothetical protein
LNITKIGYYFSKTVPGGVSWPLGPTGKLFLVRGKKNVAPPWSRESLIRITTKFGSEFIIVEATMKKQNKNTSLHYFEPGLISNDTKIK